ncbi:MAG: CDP-diacylglycerol--glycerol-3-phosphate 3-phosphatidyltransferase [Clostridia bacterium]|nr:CDP-diacylglycerol--glycerol-3-phosphate 3-phosphatidyltransferase [Clostridia bacterium]
MTTANIITIARILLVPFYVYFAAAFPGANRELIAAIIFLLISLTDFLDGYIARKYNQITDFGKFLDPLADKILVISAFVIFVSQGTLSPIIAIVVIAREFLVTSIRLVAAGKGTVIAASMSGKLKTVTQIIAVMAILLEGFLDMIFPLPYGVFFSWIMLIFTIYSGLEYLILNRKVISFN